MYADDTWRYVEDDRCSDAGYWFWAEDTGCPGPMVSEADLYWDEGRVFVQNGQFVVLTEGSSP